MICCSWALTWVCHRDRPVEFMKFLIKVLLATGLWKEGSKKTNLSWRCLWPRGALKFQMAFWALRLTSTKYLVLAPKTKACYRVWVEAKEILRPISGEILNTFGLLFGLKILIKSFITIVYIFWRWRISYVKLLRPRSWNQVLNKFSFFFFVLSYKYLGAYTRMSMVFFIDVLTWHSRRH